MGDWSGLRNLSSRIPQSEVTLAHMSNMRMSRTRRMRMAELAAKVGARHAVYGRLSLETEDTTSPARQLEIGERRVEERNGIYDRAVDHYEDIDKSGFDEAVDRPGFNRLMANLDQYDVIVVYRLDRLTRRITRFAELLKKLQEHNVTLISATEPFDTSDPMGKAMTWIIMVFAELESETIGARMQSAQNYMVRNGRFRGGQRPFGWHVSNTWELGGTYLTLHEPEAKHLRKAVGQVLSGQSIRSICVSWNEFGLKTSRGNAWAQGTLSHMLRNPILKGHGIFGETVLKDAEGAPVQVAEPLIDEVTWTRLQDVLAKRGKGGGGAHKGPSLLGGIATCALCKRPLRANSRSYVCPSFSDSHKGKTASKRKRDCVGVCVERSKLDPWVLTWVLDRLSDSRMRKAEERLAATFARRAEANSYDQSRADLSRKLDRLEEDRYDGLYDSIDERARFKRRRAEIMSEIVALDEANTAPADLMAAFDMPLTMDELLAKDIVEVRQFLMGVLGALEVRKGVRGSRRPVSDRVEIELVEALQDGRRPQRKSRRTAKAS